jgi:F-type H+-transporting ATPase subunit alpha
MIIFAANSGTLDSLPATQVRKFEEEFLQYMRDVKGALRAEIAEKKELTPELKNSLTEAINQFKASFAKSAK